jgi:hypothetical protein
MRLIKIGNKIVNLDNVSSVLFIENSKPCLTFYMKSMEDSAADQVNVKDDLAVKAWAILCKLSVDVEVPGVSNPWGD